jgi:hypothetical protein
VPCLVWLQFSLAVSVFSLFIVKDISCLFETKVIGCIWTIQQVRDVQFFRLNAKLCRLKIHWLFPAPRLFGFVLRENVDLWLHSCSLHPRECTTSCRKEQKRNSYSIVIILFIFLLFWKPWLSKHLLTLYYLDLKRDDIKMNLTGIGCECVDWLRMGTSGWLLCTR